MKTYEELNILNNSKNVCIIGHIEPDPDALASMLTLKELIKNQFKINCIDLFAETEELSFNAKLILENEELNPTIKTYDTAILIDSPSTDRAGKFSILFEHAKNKITIDHHATNLFFGDVNIVEICSSTCEIVYNICEYFNHVVSKTNQGKLYAGLIADTNNFTVGAITERTFYTASKICENVNREEIYSTFLASYSLKNIQMLALAIGNMTSYDNNQIVISHVTKDELMSHNANHNDFFGIVNTFKTIHNSKLVCFIEPRNDCYYASMRAKKGYDVSHIAKENGGGGHVGAAAFSSNKSLAEIESIILQSFRKELANSTENKFKLF